MSEICSHPAAALYTDKEQGVTICTVCDSVITQQVYELDPNFPRGAAASRQLGGSFRPVRSQVSTLMSHARPSIEAARRGMLNIARAVEISEVHVEQALGIFKLAVGVNVISGTRDSILCACLYAVCRRERTSHVIYDFSHACHISPSSILGHMHRICHATHTEVPVVDPSCMVQRFAEYLNLGDALPHVMVCALKLLRAMQDDWISCGRSPMGVCAAALIASCCLLGVPRTPEQICGIVRLKALTIMKRLTELSNTPTAQLSSIDDYQPTQQTLPPAFNETSTVTAEEGLNGAQREMSSLYFQLVGEAKISAPATPDRCRRWRLFLSEHCKLQQVAVEEEELDLTQLTPEEQLTILGLPHTKPISPEKVEGTVREEEQRLLKLHVGKEEEQLHSAGGKWLNAEDGTYPSAVHRNTQLPVYSSEMFSIGDPNHVAQLVSQYEAAKQLAEISGLRDDFDFASPDRPTPVHGAAAPGMVTALKPEIDVEKQKEILATMLWDKQRRHALPWEFIVLPDRETEDTSDIIPYILLDNEERIRRSKIGEAMYREKWKRGRAKEEEELSSIEKVFTTARRKVRRPIEKAVGIPNALERVLHGRGARTIRVSNISELIPELGAEDDDVGAAPEDWFD